MSPRDASAALRMVFRPVIRMPDQLERLAESIGEVRVAAAETIATCRTIAAVVVCTDDAGDFSR